MSSSQSTILIISGVSGGGKGTVRERIFARHPEVVEPVSATTRAPRPGDKHNFHYNFVDEPTFFRMIEQGELLEHNLFCNNYYGTPRKPVEEALAKGQNVLLEVEINGIKSILNDYPETKVVFLTPPNYDIQRHRLEQRGTAGKDLELRLYRAYEELVWAATHNISVIVNDDLEETVNEVEKLLFS